MNKGMILDTIYSVVDSWTESLRFVCGKGCSACCTANVTITATEGDKILGHIVEQGLERWLAERLAADRPLPPPEQTWNGFAAACIEGRDLAETALDDSGTCLFLEDGCCRIYPVRPLACRLFASTQPCRPGLPAALPQWYFDAATAISQVVEHLGQKEYWGRMPDVLSALLDRRNYAEIAEHLDPIHSIQARLRTLSAQPLPGFLFSEDGQGRVSALLNRLFAAEIEGKQLGDILNGR